MATVGALWHVDRCDREVVAGGRVLAWLAEQTKASPVDACVRPVLFRPALSSLSKRQPKRKSVVIRQWLASHQCGVELK